MNETRRNRRGYFQFSLAGLLVAITVAACGVRLLSHQSVTEWKPETDLKLLRKTVDVGSSRRASSEESIEAADRIFG